MNYRCTYIYWNEAKRSTSCNKPANHFYVLDIDFLNLGSTNTRCEEHVMDHPETGQSGDNIYIELSREEFIVHEVMNS